MKTKALLIIAVLLLSAINYTTQAQGVALDLGYKFHTRSLGYVGLSGSFPRTNMSFKSVSTQSINIGAGGYYGSFNGAMKFIPSAYVSYAKGAGMMFEGKLAFSEYFISPTIGLNVMNLAKLEFGYSIGTKSINRVSMDGFTIGLVVSLGSRNYYTDKKNTFFK